MEPLCNGDLLFAEQVDLPEGETASRRLFKTIAPSGVKVWQQLGDVNKRTCHADEASAGLQGCHNPVLVLWIHSSKSIHLHHLLQPQIVFQQLFTDAFWVLLPCITRLDTLAQRVGI